MDYKIIKYLCETFEEVTDEEQIANINLMTIDDCTEFANTLVAIENTSKGVIDRVWQRISLNK